MMFWYGAHWMFWQAALMWLGVLLFWGLVAWLVYALVTSSRRGGGLGRPDDHAEDPRRILDGRLARGEIDEQEYRRLLDLIEHREHARTS